MKEFRAAKSLFGVSARLINSYGLTEATIDSTFFEENRKSLADNDPVPIGKPFPHVSVYVLDEQLNPLINTMGEIYIGGKGVAKGYLERPELTKERFIIYPQTGERLYKTGDFGKLLEDGTIEFLGRNQSYIKINGNRIELLALEAVLNQHPKIEFGIAYVLTKDDHYSELGCCIVDKEMKLKFEEVIAYIQHHLPHYYLPKRIYLINEPALTQNGKIDKSFVSQQIIGELKPYQIAPRDDLEEKILALWTKEFPEHRIGVNQNFYALGGSSLVFATIITKLNHVFNVNLNFCNAPQTIEGLAQQIKIFCKTSLKQETNRFVKEKL